MTSRADVLPPSVRRTRSGFVTCDVPAMLTSDDLQIGTNFHLMLNQLGAFENSKAPKTPPRMEKPPCSKVIKWIPRGSRQSADGRVRIAGAMRMKARLVSFGCPPPNPTPIAD